MNVSFIQKNGSEFFVKNIVENIERITKEGLYSPSFFEKGEK